MDIVRAIKTATSLIGDQYFLLPVEGLEYPIKRERVYCYELYHQLRLVLDDTEFTLSAEPDKRGHPSFEGKKPNPDLIFHVPGSHRNMAVLEVECRPDLKHLKKDLETLRLMAGKGYQCLVLLLFGIHEVPWMDLEKAARQTAIHLGDVIVLLHKASGQQATHELVPAGSAR